MAARQIKGIPANLQILHVEQELPGDDTTVLDAVLAVDGERVDLLAEEAALLKAAGGGAGTLTGDGAARLAAIGARLQAIDAAGAPARASKILHGLGFDDGASKRATATFSGGWRMRVALAQALFAEPDILLLDEVRGEKEGWERARERKTERAPTSPPPPPPDPPADQPPRPARRPVARRLSRGPAGDAAGGEPCPGFLKCGLHRHCPPRRPQADRPPRRL